MSIVYTIVVNIMPCKEQDEQDFSLLEIIGKTIQRLIGKKRRSPCYFFLIGEQQEENT